MSVGGGYTRGEVLQLHGMSHQQAIDADAVPRDSCAGLSKDSHPTPGDLEDRPVPVIARWTDVKRAEARVASDRDALAILQLRASGFSEREISRLSGRERVAVRRSFHATIAEILVELGEGREEPLQLSRQDACLRCGIYPRVRLAAVNRRVRGGWKEIRAERQASVCHVCIDGGLASRIMGAEAVAA